MPLKVNEKTMILQTFFRMLTYLGCRAYSKASTPFEYNSFGKQVQHMLALADSSSKVNSPVAEMSLIN